MTPDIVRSRIAPGVCATLWTGGPLAKVLTPRTLRILGESRPQVVCLHARPEDLQVSAKHVWQDLRSFAAQSSAPWRPRLWIGVGCDSHMRQVASGHETPAQGAGGLLIGAAVADELKAELVCWDAEEACKLDPKRTGDVARQLVQSTRTHFPDLVQAHTAYYVPTYHSEADDHGIALPHGYPWSSWCGTGGVDVDLPEVYVAPPEPESGPRIMAPPGAMRAALALHRQSWTVAVRRGWIRADLPCWPYLQLHDVPYEQTITYASDPYLGTHEGTPRVGVEAYVTSGWTVEKDECDADGETSLRALCDLARRGQTVAQFQASAKLVVDGICGPLTIAALNLG